MKSQGFILVSLKIDGGERIRERITRLCNDRIQDWTVPFKMLINNWYDIQEKMFKGEGRVSGEGGVRAVKWEKLSEKYRKWKEKYYPGRKILELTGRMKEELLNRSNASVKKMEMVIPARGYLVNGWNIVRLHKYGTRKMPARDPFELSKKQKERWRLLLSRWARGEEIENVLS